MSTLSSTLEFDRKEIAEIIASDSWMSDLKNHKGLAKCSTTSLELRKEGNKIYLNSNHDASVHERAWKMYTKSIALAPQGSEELAFAFGNRSAVLLHFHMYEDCIEDVDRATKITSSDHLKAKLLIRKVECLSVLGKPLKNTMKSFNDIIQSVSLDVDSKKKLKHNLKEAAVAKGSQMHLLEAKLSKTLQLKIPRFCTSKGTPCASNACAIRHNEKYGRHLIATRDIETGEILADEKPYIMVPVSSKLHYYCWNCLKSAWASIPCDSCAYAMFCSESCKNKAWKNYHDIECPVVEYLWDMQGLDYGKSILSSLRMTVLAIREFGGISKLQESIKSWDNCNDDACAKGFSDGIFHSDSYKSISSLSVNLRDSEKLVRFKNAAMSLCMLGKHTLLFGDSFHTDQKMLAKNNDALFVGALICRNAFILATNAHEFVDVGAYVNKPPMLRRPQENISQDPGVLSSRFLAQLFDMHHEYDDSIGEIVLPFCSLINHSCSPNVARCSSENQRVILFAMRPIRKGEQIFDCYGPTHRFQAKEKRLLFLKSKYDFTCDCIPCTEDWPLDADVLSFRACIRSKGDTKEIQYVMDKFSVIAAGHGRVNFNVKGMQDICRCIDVLAKYTSKPNVELNRFIDNLNNIFLSLYGMKFFFPPEC